MSPSLRWFVWSVGALAWGPPALAKGIFKGQVPNGSQYGCKTCHTTTKPAAWNPFGLDVKATLVGKQPYWASVCELDSDQDGFPNGVELLDPDCAWSTGMPSPAPATAATKPGDPLSFPATGPEPVPEPVPEAVPEAAPEVGPEPQAELPSEAAWEAAAEAPPATPESPPPATTPEPGGCQGSHRPTWALAALALTWAWRRSARAA
jgi:hypothetical protein